MTSREQRSWKEAPDCARVRTTESTEEDEEGGRQYRNKRAARGRKEGRKGQARSKEQRRRVTTNKQRVEEEMATTTEDANAMRIGLDLHAQMGKRQQPKREPDSSQTTVNYCSDRISRSTRESLEPLSIFFSLKKKLGNACVFGRLCFGEKKGLGGAKETETETERGKRNLRRSSVYVGLCFFSAAAARVCKSAACCLLLRTRSTFQPMIGRCSYKAEHHSPLKRFCSGTSKRAIF